MKKIYSYLTLVLLITPIISCNTKQQGKVTKQPIALLNSLREDYGAKPLANSTVSFDVDDVHYIATHKDQIITYTMSRKLKDKQYRTTYNNGFIEYFVNDTLQDETTYNRVFFDSKLDGFVFNTFTPHLLKGTRYIVELSPDVLIDKINYNVLKITTKAVPEVPTDIYFLYVNSKTNLVMYAAQYHKLSHNLPTFKRFYNHRKIEGILLADYHLFQAKEESTPIDKLHASFSDLSLEPIQNINYKNIEVVIY